MTSVSYCKNPKDQNSLNPAEQKSLSWADPPPKLPGCNASSPRGDVSGVAGTVPTVICLGRKVSQAQNRPLSWRWRIGMSGFIPKPDPQKGERETALCPPIEHPARSPAACHVSTGAARLAETARVQGWPGAWARWAHQLAEALHGRLSVHDLT